MLGFFLLTFNLSQKMLENIDLLVEIITVKFAKNV